MFHRPSSAGQPEARVGAKKFGVSLETREVKLFWPGYPGILPGYPGDARKVWENKFVSILVS